MEGNFLYGTYALEGEINFSPVKFGVFKTLRSVRTRLFEEGSLIVMRAVEFLQLELNLTLEKLKCVHKMIMCEEKHPNE